MEKPTPPLTSIAARSYPTTEQLEKIPSKLVDPCQAARKVLVVILSHLSS
ncbi:hypothetical protein CROQUDRAFT_94944 [Cronartium quercuum f. sp. fusiforme G11]|uniref:Uncharacterized protein n=1 Tax=Cronartium quercuum f. sp. fusiforme G11 TaxID=708437 RepID=A0A9P6ND79_9BASI|nr:hypothetical protein CROQUDRAFT_94944 [Cronartium quercuum f. sp. fusiforme G11]